jgi:hypothetical protein
MGLVLLPREIWFRQRRIGDHRNFASGRGSAAIRSRTRRYASPPKAIILIQAAPLTPQLAPLALISMTTLTPSSSRFSPVDGSLPR